MYKHTIAFTLALLSSSIAYADDYQNAVNYIQNQGLTSSSADSLNSTANLQVTMPTDAQVQQYSQYSNNPDNMSLVGKRNKNYSKLVTDTLNAPTIQINPNSSMVQNSQTIQDNADSIAAGTYKDCDQKAFNKQKYINKTCDKPRIMDFTCHTVVKATVPTADPGPIENCSHLVYLINQPAPANSQHLFHYTDYRHWIFGRWFFTNYDIYSVPGADSSGMCYLNGSLIDNVGSGSKSISVDLPKYHTYTVHSIIGSSEQSNYTMNSTLTDNKDSKVLASTSFSGSVQSLTFNESHGSTGQYTDEKNATLNYDISTQGSNSYVNFSYITLVKDETPDAVLSTVDECANNPVTTSPACIAGTPICDDNKERIYNGKTYTPSCWDEETTYHCGGKGPNGCSALQAQKCDILSSNCTQKIGDICVHESDTYQCPDGTISGDTLKCGENIFCLDGDCQAVSQDQNKDFGQAATQLSAVNSAASDVKSQQPAPGTPDQNIKIFTGKAMSCRDIGLGIMNCCKDSGWAKGILTNCSDEENELGKAREKGNLVVSLGRYCAHHILGWCSEHKEGFCEFPNTMAYDVQLGGRPQIGENFGSAQSPSCDGFTPEQVQHIDFSKIDFSNVVNDTENNTSIPSDGSQSSDIQKEIQEEMQRRQQSSQYNLGHVDHQSPQLNTKLEGIIKARQQS